MIPCAYASACAAFFEIGSLDELTHDQDDDLAAVIETIPDASPDVETGYIEREQLEQVPRFLASLPPRLRDIVYRHYWLDQSQAEIADALGVTRSAVCHALAKVKRLGQNFFGVRMN